MVEGETEPVKLTTPYQRIEFSNTPVDMSFNKMSTIKGSELTREQIYTHTF